MKPADVASAEEFYWRTCGPWHQPAESLTAGVGVGGGVRSYVRPRASVSTGLSARAHKSQLGSTPPLQYTLKQWRLLLGQRSIQKYMWELLSRGGLCVGSAGRPPRAGLGIAAVAGRQLLSQDLGIWFSIRFSVQTLESSHQNFVGGVNQGMVHLKNEALTALAFSILSILRMISFS